MNQIIKNKIDFFNDFIISVGLKENNYIIINENVYKKALYNNLIKEFGCKYDCIRELKMSDKTLAKTLFNNVPYNNYYYKELGEKLSVN